jgi:manganese transport protein
VVWAGVDATHALIWSQVVLSLAVPVPMAALIWFASRRELMRQYRSHWATLATALIAALIVTALGVALISETLAG